MAAMKRFFFKEMVKNRTRIDWLVEENLFHCKFTMKARGLEFLVEGEGSGLSLTMLSMGT